MPTKVGGGHHEPLRRPVDQLDPELLVQLRGRWVGGGELVDVSRCWAAVFLAVAPLIHWPTVSGLAPCSSTTTPVVREGRLDARAASVADATRSRRPCAAAAAGTRRSPPPGSTGPAAAPPAAAHRPPGRSP